MRHFTSQSMTRLFFSAVKIALGVGLSSVWMRLSSIETVCTSGQLKFRPGSVMTDLISPKVLMTATLRWSTMNSEDEATRIATIAMPAKRKILFMERLLSGRGHARCRASGDRWPWGRSA
jgi:hypothetical protein